ncbi:MAG: hypothetical protein OZSIB_0062 [Candidatus Ozemobacter sibiricus]|jgi:uncharacterized membrane protein|uniref:TPM domain-containing protein n=1 Tax=Candidatus Ozemobacter sibiricus TaxID=2268124 RepID=A0A367ZPW9_9BACT|nr:MAG: hypothetical protein OZSIB_0062 [Candidatus Ozemobacter sibiricus]
MDPRSIFGETERQELEAAIREAEGKTSGEIRIHIEDTCPGDPFERAKIVFAYLRMGETAQRNGVLFYLAVGSRAFAILADEGINLKVPPGFWDSIRDKAIAEFREGRFKDGLLAGVRAAGEQLAAWFPRQADDRNELSDTISFGER